MVSFHFIAARHGTQSRSSCSELQGHAIKNQDLLIASGTISLKGSEGMSAVDDDVEAAVSTTSVKGFPPTHPSDFSLEVRFSHRTCWDQTFEPGIVS
jgi:hypothetical protein